MDNNYGLSIFVAVDRVVVVDVIGVRQVVAGQSVIGHDEFILHVGLGLGREQRESSVDCPEHFIAAPGERGHFPQTYVLVGIGGRFFQLQHSSG